MSTTLEPMVNIVFQLFAPQPQQYSITNLFGNMGGGGFTQQYKNIKTLEHIFKVWETGY